MPKNSAFDLDFGYGKKGEKLVEELLTEGRTVEVKRDRKWYKTNNLYIETSCYFKSTEAWGDSGLNVTEAAYWAFVLQVSIILVPTHILKYAVDKFGREITCDIPPNLSKGKLITVDNLMVATKEYKSE